jgi:hypothetical protein
VGAFDVMFVGIDDPEYGATLTGGQSQDWDLTPGSHTLYWGSASSDYFSEHSFELEPNQHMNATATFGKGIAFN